MKTAILGGGLTGLTLARLLHERGEEVIVLEAEPEIGGLCRSKQKDGFTFDVGGSHIIFSRDTEVLSFMRRMIAGNEQENKRNTKIFYKQRLVKYPFENGLSDLPPEDRFFCINEFIKTLIEVEKGTLLPPTNFKEWIYHTFGKGIAECYMVPYNEKIWKFPTDKMSMHWVDGRIPRPPVEDIVKSAIGIDTEGYTHQAIFSYPLDGGIEALVLAIAKPVLPFVRTNFRVSSVKRSGKQWVIGDGLTTVTADRCICTMPVQHLMPCLDSVPGSIQTACNELRYNSLVCVNIALRGSVPAISWMYVPDPGLGRTNRLSFPSTYSQNGAPQGCSTILAEITHQPGDEVATMSDTEISKEVLAMCEKMQLVSRSNLISVSVERQPYAYVVYDLKYQDNVALVRKYCESLGIPLVGRFAQFEYLNMDGCIRSVFDFVSAQ